MSDIIDVRATLYEQALELDRLSQALAHVSRELEPVENDYREFVDDYELGLLTRSEDDPKYKLPPAALRLKLAHKAMDPALLGRYMALTASRTRLLQRIGDLGRAINAQRTLVYAAKAEQDATS